MKRYMLLGLVFAGCSDSDETLRPAFTDVVLEATVRTTGGETLSLEDGAEIILPDNMFESSQDVTFRRETCGGIFSSQTFDTCLYSVSFDSSPDQRFEVNLVGDGNLNAEEEGEFKPVGVLNRGTALSSRKFANRSGDDARCLDTLFVACGGDVTGEWELNHACGPRQAILSVYSTFNPDPYEVCGPGEWLREYPFTTNQTLTFSASGTYGRKGSFDVKERRILTQTCLNLVGESCHETCKMKNGICECLYDESSGDGAGGGRWTYGNSTTLIFDGPDPLEEESGPGVENEFCVEGDTLTVKSREAVFVYGRN